MANYDTPVPRELLDIAARELDKGERIEWSAMPRPRFFTKGSIGAFLFAIPWTAFAVFWTVMAGWGVSKSGSSVAWFFPLFGLPFILVGLGMLSTPLWAMRRDKNTLYVITDRRAITFVGGRSVTIRTYPPENLHGFFRREKADGSGDIVFSTTNNTDFRRNSVGTEQGFFGIARVRDVDERLRKLAAKSGASGEKSRSTDQA